MKQTDRILDLLGDQVEVLQARIVQLDDFKAKAEAVFARMQTIVDTIKGEPEEAATKDPFEALAAVMARWKLEAQIAVGRANDSGRVVQELQQRLTDLQTQGLSPAEPGKPLPFLVKTADGRPLAVQSGELLTLTLDAADSLYLIAAVSRTPLHLSEINGGNGHAAA